MTDNEISKALECHIKRRCWDNCPNATEERQLLIKPCSQMIAEDALSLINRQKAEISELQHRNFELDIELKAMRGAANSYKAEIERLQKHIKEGIVLARQLPELASAIQAEAIKDVLLTLEAEAVSSDKYIREYDGSEVQKAYNQALWKAYNLVKEMVGEDK